MPAACVNGHLGVELPTSRHRRASSPPSISPPSSPSPPVRYRQQPEDIDPAVAPSVHALERRQRRGRATAAVLETPGPSFAATIRTHLAKILLTCGFYLWYLVARAAVDYALEWAAQFFDTQKQKLTNMSEFCDNPVSELYHRRASASRAARRGPAKDDLHVYSESTSDGTVRLRMRHSLRKRKEQILFGSPRSPGSPASPASPVSSTSPDSAGSPPSSPNHLVNNVHYNHTLNRLNCRRARTNSEMLELDDQVMPLPNIRHRSRRWKSCGNMSSASISPNSNARSLFRISQMQQRQQQRQQQQQAKKASEPIYIRVNHNNNYNYSRGGGKNGLVERKLSPPKKMYFVNGSQEIEQELSKADRARNPSADDVEVTRRRVQLLLRRQGRQLSDPSSFTAWQQMRMQQQQGNGQVQQQQQRRYLVVERRLEGLSLETSRRLQRASPAGPAAAAPKGPLPLGEQQNQVNRSGNLGAVEERERAEGPSYLVRQQQAKSAQRGP